MMICKTYIGIPGRGSGSGQSLVTVCDGQKAAAAPPSAAINSRRPMLTGMCPSPREGCLVRNDTTLRASGLHRREGGDAGAAPQP